LRANKPIPKKLENPPELWPHNALYFNAFLDLNTSRALGFGAGPLSWQAIHEYCIANGFDEEQYDNAHFLLRQMDTLFLTLMDKKERQKKQAEEQKAKLERNKRGR
jgi:hypothetical protein